MQPTDDGDPTSDAPDVEQLLGGLPYVVVDRTPDG